jgi:hypothetical protein
VQVGKSGSRVELRHANCLPREGLSAVGEELEAAVNHERVANQWTRPIDEAFREGLALIVARRAKHEDMLATLVELLIE